jgi:3-hydroxyisobutyrate dehydrogenase
MSGEAKVQIGFVGVGVMGRPMASNLIKAGYPCSIFDVNPAPLKALEADGGKVASSPAEAAKGADIFITMVVNDAQFLAILFEPGNAARALNPGATVIGMSTMSMATVKEVATRLKEMRIAYLDAPVSGGEPAAQTGQLSIMAGCSDEVMERCRPVLSVLGSQIYHVGPNPGDGQAVKMINQLMVSVHLVTAAEALTFAQKVGLDKQMVFDIISKSAGNSWILGNRGPRMLSEEFVPPKSAMNILVKDIGFVVDTANKLGHPLVMASAAQQLFKMASAMGLGQIDDAAMIKLMQQLAGMEKLEKSDEPK